MPKRGAIALALTAFALVLLLGFQTPGAGENTVLKQGAGATGGVAQVAPASGATGAATPVPTASRATGSAGRTGVPSAAAPTPGATSSAGAGAATSDTRFGPVQVSVTLNGKLIVAISAVQLPASGRSGRISNYAAPILHDQALQAQSASITGVSGATYTSQAFEQSLQAALNAAGA